MSDLVGYDDWKLDHPDEFDEDTTEQARCPRCDTYSDQELWDRLHCCAHCGLTAAEVADETALWLSRHGGLSGH